jgi:hypothetical protein
MSDGFVPEMAVTPYLQDLEPAEFRAMIYGSANAQQIRWWRALLNPAYNARNGATDERGKWLHEEVDVSQYRVAISDGRTIKRYLPQGEIQSGDMTVLVMPDEIDLGDQDWVICLGRQRSAPLAGLPSNAPLHTQKEAHVRGELTLARLGVVSSAGAVVTGIATHFLTDAPAGSIVRAAGASYRVLAATSDTRLVLESAPHPTWNENDYTVQAERLLWSPVFDIQDLRDTEQTYVSGVDYRVGDDEQTLVWISGAHCPPPGATFSVMYRNYPRYKVMGDQGLVNHAVNGVRLPSTFTLRLVKLDSMLEG